MIRITINNQNFHFTPEQLEALNGILSKAVVLKEKYVNDKYSYVPDESAKPMQIRSVNATEWV